MTCGTTSWLIDAPTKSRVIENALARNASKHPARSRRASDVFNDEQLDILGALGEYAAAAFCGAQYDWEIRNSGDNGVDFTASGLGYAVKFNHRQDGHLIVEQRQQDTAVHLEDLLPENDIIILTTGLCKPPQKCHCARSFASGGPALILLRGWLSRQEFMAQMQFKDWGLGGRWFVKADDLHDIRDLLALRRR